MRKWLASPTEAASPPTAAVLREYDSIVAEFSRLAADGDVASMTERHVLLARYVSEAAAVHPDVVGQRPAWVSKTLVAVQTSRESGSLPRTLADRLIRALLSICDGIASSTSRVFDEWIADLVEFTVQTTEHSDRVSGLRVLAETASKHPAQLDSETRTLLSVVETTDERELVARVFRETIPVGKPPNEPEISALFDWLLESTGEQRATVGKAIKMLAREHPGTAAEHVERLEPVITGDADPMDFLYVRILLEVSQKRPATVYSVAEPIFTRTPLEVVRKPSLMLYRALVQLVPEQAAAQVDWFFDQLKTGDEGVLYIGGHVLMLLAELEPEAYAGYVDQVVSLLPRVEDAKLEELLASLCLVTEHCEIHLSESAAETLASYLTESPMVRGYAALVLKLASVPETWDLHSDAVNGADAVASEGETVTDSLQVAVDESPEATLSNVIEDVEAETGELDPGTETVSLVPFAERDLYRDESIVELVNRAEELAERRSPAVLSLLPRLVEYARHDSKLITIMALETLVMIAETYPGMVASDLPPVLTTSGDDSHVVLLLKLQIVFEVLSSDRTGLLGIDEEMDQVVAFLVSVSQREEPTLRSVSVECLGMIRGWNPEFIQKHIGGILEGIDINREKGLFIRGMMIQAVAQRDSTLIRSHFGELLDIIEAPDASRYSDDPSSEIAVGMEDSFLNTHRTESDEVEPTKPYLFALWSVILDDPGLVVTHSEQLLEMLRAGHQPQTSYAAFLLSISISVEPGLAETFASDLGDLLEAEKPVLCRRTAARLFAVVATNRPDIVASHAPAVVSALERADARDTDFVQDCLTAVAAVIHEIPETEYPQFETVLQLLQHDEAFREPIMKILSVFSQTRGEALRSYRGQFEEMYTVVEDVDTKLAAVEVLLNTESRARGVR